MTSVYGQWQYQKFSLLVLMEMIHREARYMYTLTTSDTHMTNITAPVAQQETSSDFLYLYQTCWLLWVHLGMMIMEVKVDQHIYF